MPAHDDNVMIPRGTTSAARRCTAFFRARWIRRITTLFGVLLLIQIVVVVLNQYIFHDACPVCWNIYLFTWFLYWPSVLLAERIDLALGSDAPLLGVMLIYIVLGYLQWIVVVGLLRLIFKRLRART